MSAKTDAPRDAGEPDFERGAQRIREEDRDIERLLAPNRSDDGKEGTRFQEQHFIDLGHELPDGSNFFRGRDGDVSIGPARFNRAHCRHADHAVAEPVRSDDENPKRFQILRGNFRRQMDPALVMGEEKIRRRRFPAIVDPKPIVWSLTNLLLDRSVAFPSDGVDRIAGRIERRSKNQPPARRTFGVNRGCDHRGAGPFRQQSRERRRRSESSEKRRP